MIDLLILSTATSLVLYAFGIGLKKNNNYVSSFYHVYFFFIVGP